ncbi:MAG TPA: aminotransferase class IV [Chitinophagaceae bacterium]
MNGIAFINGEFIEEKNATLHISDLSVQRGYGIFDAFRTINNVPLFLDDHLSRFFNSAEGLNLNPGLSREELKSIVSELILKNNIPGSIFRITLTGGYSTDGYLPSIPNLIVTQHPLKPRSAQWVKHGMRVITHEHVRELPLIKSINYLTGVNLQGKLVSVGADDVLYYHNNEVSEFPRSNFFIVTRKDEIITPASNILHGITRKKTLELARKNFAVYERKITLTEIAEAKEAFTTSTTKQILPVVEIDGNEVGNGLPGKITQLLDEHLQQLCNNHTNMLLDSQHH